MISADGWFIDAGHTTHPDLVSGRRALDYEFCIPASEECAREVAAIDTTVVILRSSPGRIECGSGEYLCIGNTHQKRFREVLGALARLEYVGRIDECGFE